MPCASASAARPGRAICSSSAVTLVLWLTVWFANFAEALAEVRGQAQADSLRCARQDVVGAPADRPAPGLAPPTTVSGLRARARATSCASRRARSSPPTAKSIEGVASVDESAVTGESAPVIRESGGDRSAVTGGTRVLSDWLVVRVTAEPGDTFLDRMIAMVEGAVRQKTPNEIALGTLLVGFTVAFLIVWCTLYPIGSYFGTRIDVATLVALLVCLIPTTIGALLSAIGIAGMTRLWAVAMCWPCSGRAVEAAGDVDVLLLDKTGTITLGNRRATRFVPAPGVAVRAVAEAAQLASLADETPEGRSIVVLAKDEFELRAPQAGARSARASSPSPPRRGCPASTSASARSARAPPTRWRSWLTAAGGRLDPAVAQGQLSRSPRRRHAPRRRRGGTGRRPRARRGPPQGHRQGRHRRSASPSCAGWASRR